VRKDFDIPMPAPDQWGPTDWTAFISVIVAALTGVALVYIEIDKKFFATRRLRLLRERELNDPVDIHFLVPPRSQRTVEYAEQDDREHLLYEIILAPLASTIVEVRIQPRTRFVTDTFLFGCAHDDADLIAKELKPCPMELIDIYGQGHIRPNSRPGETPGHVINSRLQYRWNHEIKWNALTTLVLGIRIKTNATGTYVWETRFVGDEAESLKTLTIRVESQEGLLLNCVNGEHERHTIRPALRGTPLSS
jgi:hypothetical protein